MDEVTEIVEVVAPQAVNAKTLLASAGAVFIGILGAKGVMHLISRRKNNSTVEETTPDNV